MKSIVMFNDWPMSMTSGSMALNIMLVLSLTWHSQIVVTNSIKEPMMYVVSMIPRFHKFQDFDFGILHTCVSDTHVSRAVLLSLMICERELKTTFMQWRHKKEEPLFRMSFLTWSTEKKFLSFRCAHLYFRLQILAERPKVRSCSTGVFHNFLCGFFVVHLCLLALSLVWCSQVLFALKYVFSCSV